VAGLLKMRLKPSNYVKIYETDISHPRYWLGWGPAYYKGASGRYQNSGYIYNYFRGPAFRNYTSSNH
jgi:hypothetical protein